MKLPSDLIRPEGHLGRRGRGCPGGGLGLGSGSSAGTEPVLFGGGALTRGGQEWAGVVSGGVAPGVEPVAHESGDVAYRGGVWPGCAVGLGVEGVEDVGQGPAGEVWFAEQCRDVGGGERPEQGDSAACLEGGEVALGFRGWSLADWPGWVWPMQRWVLV